MGGGDKDPHTQKSDAHKRRRKRNIKDKRGTRTTRREAKQKKKDIIRIASGGKKL